MSESLQDLSAAASQGDWTYPGWGTDFRAGKRLVGMASPQGDGNGKADRAFIVALVNAYRAGRLVEAPDLPTPAISGAQEG